MDEAGAGHHRYSFQSQQLLRVGCVVQAQTVGKRGEIQIAYKTIFVFELVAHSGARPPSLKIIALVFESRAVDVCKSMEGRIKNPAGIVYGVHVGALMVVFETGEAMLPT